MPGEMILGFTMYGSCKDQQFYELCRLTMDKRWQGKGYGSKVLRLVLHEMKSFYSQTRKTA